ncbi:MAG: hypothetical protein AABW59_02700 [archaeon]
MVFRTIANMFKGKDKPSEPIKTTLEYLPSFIESSFVAKRKMLEESTATKMAEIKYLHGKCLVILENLNKKELEEKSNVRFNKAALTSKTQLQGQLSRILSKINPANRAKTLEDAMSYSAESFVILSNEINHFRKNIVYTSVYLKEDMKILGESLQEMQNNLKALNHELSGEKEVFGFEKSKERIGAMLKEKEKVQKITLEENLLGEKLITAREKLSSQEEKIQSLLKGQEMSELTMLEEEKAAIAQEKQEIKTEISNLIITIDRPLQRFKSLVDSGRWKLTAEQKSFLDSFMVNPLVALKSDPKAEMFKHILAEIKAAIQDEKIELKDREKEKRLAALDELMTFNFFDKVFWKMNEIQKKQLANEKELSESKTLNMIELENKRKSEIESMIGDIQLEIGAKEKEKESVLEKIRKEKEAIEQFASSTLKRTVILLD